MRKTTNWQLQQLQVSTHLSLPLYSLRRPTASRTLQWGSVLYAWVVARLKFPLGSDLGSASPPPLWTLTISVGNFKTDPRSASRVNFNLLMLFRLCFIWVLKFWVCDTMFTQAEQSYITNWYFDQSDQLWKRSDVKKTWCDWSKEQLVEIRMELPV